MCTRIVVYFSIETENNNNEKILLNYEIVWNYCYDVVNTLYCIVHVLLIKITVKKITNIICLIGGWC